LAHFDALVCVLLLLLLAVFGLPFLEFGLGCSWVFVYFQV
jgi:hypothetical protein